MLTASGGLTHAWRRLAAAPAFSFFAVLTLSLGIGAATASYSIIRAVLAPPSLTGGLSALLGGFALVIALAGLYGALSHIGCRSCDIGIRLTLGATRRQVMWLVVADGLRPVVSGVIIGFVVGTVVRMALRSWFVRSFPSIDVFVLAIAPLSLLAVAGDDCRCPPRRARGSERGAAGPVGSTRLADRLRRCLEVLRLHQFDRQGT